MELSKLEKATKIFNAIKVLDAEIVELDKVAMIVANGGGESSFELTINGVIVKDETEKVKFDEDGSLILPKENESPYRSIFLDFALPSYFRRDEKKEEKNKTVIKNSLSEKSTMLILGILLEEKKMKRNKYLKQLEKIGVNI